MSQPEGELFACLADRHHAATLRYKLTVQPAKDALISGNTIFEFPHWGLRQATFLSVTVWMHAGMMRCRSSATAIPGEGRSCADCVQNSLIVARTSIEINSLYAVLGLEMTGSPPAGLFISRRAAMTRRT